MASTHKILTKLGLCFSIPQLIRTTAFSTVNKIHKINISRETISTRPIQTSIFNSAPNQDNDQQSTIAMSSIGTKTKSTINSDKNGGSNNEGIIMILSPAKTLDMSPYKSQDYPSFPLPTDPICQTDNTLKVVQYMKQQKKQSLEKLLGISSKLADTAFQYWQDFSPDSSQNASDACNTLNFKPAIFTFTGAAYQGLNAQEFLENSSDPTSSQALSYLQKNLHIIDPLYGVLKPMDKMQPYRLEMATKGLTFKWNNSTPSKKSLTNKNNKVILSEFWKPSVTAYLKKEIQSRVENSASQKDNNHILILNLASDEYSAAVDGSDLILPNEHTNGSFKIKYIKVIFQQEGRVIAVHAKRARGLMVRYLSINQIDELEGVRQFSEEGYQYMPTQSKDNTIVFDREKPPAKTKTVSKSTSKSTARVGRKKGREDLDSSKKTAASKRTRSKK